MHKRPQKPRGRLRALPPLHHPKRVRRHPGAIAWCFWWVPRQCRFHRDFTITQVRRYAEAIFLHHVITGDSAIVLGHFAEGSVDAVICDPPFGLSFMGAEWDRDLPSQRIFDECLRVLKPGGHIFVMSSERLDCIAGFYHLLANAGFEVDNHQLIGWLTLSGMPKSSDVAKTADKEAFRAWLAMHRETVTCPDHKEPIDPVTKEKQRCVECERVFVAGGLTRHDQRKAESAAVNGECPGSFPQMDPRSNPNVAVSDTGFDRFANKPDTALLTRLLASHWPASPAEQRAHWEACVAEVPEEWDCSRPPGVRVKTGSYKATGTAARTSEGRGVCAFRTSSAEQNVSEVDPDAHINITAPSTPDAVRFDGWRGSVAPMKPMLAPILHACKPWRGSYLDCARESGGAVLNVSACGIPFSKDQSPAANRWGGANTDATETRTGNPFQSANDGGGTGLIHDGEGARVPGNLLSYGDLLADLQRYADLSAWCEKLGLPASAAELLEAGLVYAPKPSRAQKASRLLRLRDDLTGEEQATVLQQLSDRGVLPVSA